ncbi:MAG TPA: MotA/TolQ/ExbB proton channel family protein, partial [Gammaproteobacteria bacterium]
MRRPFFNEFLYQVFSLLVATIIVHAVYVSQVRPRATEILAEQALRIQEEVGYTPERSIWVLIRDFEQEACFILM